MAKIHLPGSAYTAPAAISGWQWLPYAAKGHLATLRAAMSIIENRIKGHKPCNQAFKALSGGRTFSQVWADNSIWVSYDPGKQSKRYGATLGTKHVTLSDYTMKMGRWTVAATLVHELAHTNGASGTDSKAEDTLKSCLLKGLHDPAIIGNLRRPAPGTKLMA